MPLLPVGPPQPIHSAHGFDYVAVDAKRSRVYAAHPSAGSLLVVDAATGKVLASVHVGTVHGVAINPHNGHVFTGNGVDETVSEVDPETGNVIRKIAVSGPVDAIAYDEQLERLYADEDDGNRIFVIDAITFTSVGTVALPGHHPEYLAIDPRSHDIYQNIADRNEYVVVDSRTLQVKQTVPTGAITNNHPLQFDARYSQVIIGGKGGLALYGADGRKRAALQTQEHFDQCDFSAARGQLLCAGGGHLNLYEITATQILPLASRSVAARAHTSAIDQANDTAWTVWSEDSGEYVQHFQLPQPQ